MKRKIGRKWAGAVFLVPSLLGVLLFVILPFGDVVRRSFMTAVTKEAAGVKNYKIVFTNSAFLLAVKNTLKFTLDKEKCSCIKLFLVWFLSSWQMREWQGCCEDW